MSGQASIFDVLEGEKRKQQGMFRADAAEDEEWKRRADDAILRLAKGGVPFTAEDIRQIAGNPSRPNAFGARLNTAAKRGLIKKVDYQLATRPTLHRHPIAVWIGAA